MSRVYTELWIDGRKEGPSFGSFINAMNYGFHFLDKSKAKEIEIFQMNLKGELVSLGKFNYEKARTWYLELIKAEERDMAREGL